MTHQPTLFDKIDASVSKKIDLFQHDFWRYAMRAILACMFLTIGTGVGLAIGIKGEGIAHGLGKILYAFTFSWGLVMIIFMNSELGTSNMFYLSAGVFRKKLSLTLAMKILLTCILFNLVGGVLFGYLMAETSFFQGVGTDPFVMDIVAHKLIKPWHQIIIEGMFANILVNTAVVISMRMKDDIGKVVVIVVLVGMFALMGFEHIIANFPSFTMAFALSQGQMAEMTLFNVLHNFFFAFIGNLLGGGLVVGIVAAWLNKTNTHYID